MDTTEAQIRTAYEALATRRNDWVRLADVRALVHADHDDVTNTVLAMTRTGLVHIAPDSDRRAITAADRAAAITLGREDNHLLVIEAE